MDVCARGSSLQPTPPSLVRAPAEGSTAQDSTSYCTGLDPILRELYPLCCVERLKGSNSVPRLVFSFLTLKSEDVWGEPRNEATTEVSSYLP